MKTPAITGSPTVRPSKTSLLLACLSLAATSAVATSDYGPAVDRMITGCTKWYTSGYGHKFCVVHDMEGYYLTGTSYLRRCDLTVSCHYTVNGLTDYSGDAAPGEISQLVSESYYAWHATCWNQHSLGVEHEGFVGNPAWFTEEMYQASALLFRHFCDKFGIPKDRNHIVGHDAKRDATWAAWAEANLGIDAHCNSHTDPGLSWDWTHYMALIAGEVNNAAVAGSSVPTTVTPGQTFTASITMNNNGGKAWTSDGTAHNLGSQNPPDNGRWGMGRVPLPSQPINPGQSVTFTFTATAPSAPGVYAFDWRMVEDGVEWFGQTFSAAIYVIAPPAPGQGTPIGSYTFDWQGNPNSGGGGFATEASCGYTVWYPTP